MKIVKKGIFVLVAFLLLQVRGFTLRCYKYESDSSTEGVQHCPKDTAADGRTGKGCVATSDIAGVADTIPDFGGTPDCCGTDLCNGVGPPPEMSTASTTAAAAMPAARPYVVAALICVALFILLFNLLFNLFF